jgi:hypothetical protein
MTPMKTNKKIINCSSSMHSLCRKLRRLRRRRTSNKRAKIKKFLQRNRRDYTNQEEKKGESKKKRNCRRRNWIEKKTKTWMEMMIQTAL